MGQSFGKSLLRIVIFFSVGKFANEAHNHRIIGSIITCATNGIAMLIVGRVINGFAVGICSAQVPVYISELAPPSKRGRLVGTQQWAITWGA